MNWWGYAKWAMRHKRRSHHSISGQHFVYYWMRVGCVVSAFCCSVKEIFTLLGFYSMWNPRKPKMLCRMCCLCFCLSSEIQEEAVVACEGTGDAGEKYFWLQGEGSSVKSWMFQPVKKFPAFIEPRDSLTMFTRAHHWTTILSPILM